MNYIWELLLMSDAENMKQEQFHFCPAANPSPYQELSIELLNAHSVGEAFDKKGDVGNSIEVNPLYRFGKEFSGIFDINVVELKQSRKIFFDVVMHYIGRLDLRSGMSRNEYYLWLLEQDFDKKSFGSSIRENFEQFLPKEKSVVIQALFNLCRSGNYLEEFKRAVMAIYSQAIIYESTDSAHELLVYLGKKETEAERNRITMLIDLCLPIQETVHIFYDHHFGIIGIDETMLLDEMVLF